MIMAILTDRAVHDYEYILNTIWLLWDDYDYNTALVYSLLGQIYLIIIQLQYNYNTIWPLYLIILIACHIYIII